MWIPVSGTENNTSIWKWHIISTQIPMAEGSFMVMANLGWWAHRRAGECDPTSEHSWRVTRATTLHSFNIQPLRTPLLLWNQWAARQASLSITNSENLLKLMFIKSMMPSNYRIFCHSILLLPSIFPIIRVFSKSQFFTSEVKVLELQLQHQSFQRIVRIDFF